MVKMARWTDEEVLSYYHRSFILGTVIGIGMTFVTRGNRPWGKLFQEVLFVGGGSTGISMAYIAATRDKD